MNEEYVGSSFEDFHPNYTKEEIDTLVELLTNKDKIMKEMI